MEYTIQNSLFNGGEIPKQLHRLLYLADYANSQPETAPNSWVNKPEVFTEEIIDLINHNKVTVVMHSDSAKKVFGRKVNKVEIHFYTVQFPMGLGDMRDFLNNHKPITPYMLADQSSINPSDLYEQHVALSRERTNFLYQSLLPHFNSLPFETLKLRKDGASCFTLTNLMVNSQVTPQPPVLCATSYWKLVLFRKGTYSLALGNDPDAVGILA